MSPGHRAYLSFLSEQLRRQASLAHLFAILLPYLEATLILALLDLEPARELLAACYSRRKGGRPPKDPVAMLRCLVLMALLNETSFNAWVKRLDREPVLAILAGFLPQQRPAIGTLYLFADRLLDGPYVRPCPHVSRPSARRKGSRGVFRRNLSREKERAQREREQLRRQGLPDAPVKHAVAQALASLSHPRPTDFQQRLEDLLFRCAVVPSAARGLLGNLAALTIAGDGSPLESQASGLGRPLCSCSQDGQPHCDCDRSYSDCSATWGWDSHREKYVFGYRLHLLVATALGVELPLHLSLDGAHAPDVLLAVQAMTRLVQLLRQYLPGAHLKNAIFDAAYDAADFARLLLRLDTRPIIPLNPRTAPLDHAGLPRDDHGVPLCPGGEPMRFHGFDRAKGVCVFNCPAKRPTRKNGHQLFTVRPDRCPLGTLCEPASVMGPLVRLSVDDNPRLNPPLPRDTDEWLALYSLRTSAERLFSFDKEAGGLGHRPYRRHHLVLLLALALALKKHALAWVKQRFSREQRPQSFQALLDWLDQLATAPQEVPAAAA